MLSIKTNILSNLVSSNDFNPDAWDTDFTHGVWDEPLHTCTNWYGYKRGDPIGTMKITLNGMGHGTLEFGNCWNTGVVKVYLDGSEIEAAGPGEFKVVSFEYNDSSVLKISEFNMAIIQINNFCIG